ncbi:MAG: flavodoxin family protein [Candidatus Altiarchaeales archaeon]|nr:flavodoxin family protein [Candidatus Altiarchaeales archaeon]
MRVLGLSGSHRRAGNTDQLVEKTLDVLRGQGFNTEFISLADKSLDFCKDCDGCRENPRCVFDEDDQNYILDELQAADAIVIGSPVYFGGVSSRLKTVFDRTLPLRRAKLSLAGKIGAAITVGGSRNGGQEHTIADIHHFMLIHEMIIVGDQKTAHFGGCAQGRGQGDALKDEVGVQTVINTAEKIGQTLKKINPHI